MTVETGFRINGGSGRCRGVVTGSGPEVGVKVGFRHIVDEDG